MHTKQHRTGFQKGFRSQLIFFSPNREGALIRITKTRRFTEKSIQLETPASFPLINEW